MHRRTGWVAAAVAAALAALGLAAVPAAQAVGTGNPVIVSPASTADHYAGFDGPFEVTFEDAPTGTYEYSVTYSPPGGGPAELLYGPQEYQTFGTGEVAQLRVSALTPGTGYTFHITDQLTGTHTADLPFSVNSGPAPTCSIVVPSQVRVNGPRTLIVGRLSAGCTTTRTTYAAWRVRHVTRGYANTYVFSGNPTSTWTLFDDEPTGTYLITPLGATDVDHDPVPQNDPRTVIRLGSRLSLSAHRSGSHVTLASTLTRYVPSSNRFRAWAARSVTYSYRTCSTCAWHRLTTKRTSSSGHTSYRLRASSVREYRAVAGGTTTIWSPITPRVRR
ncbi:MAG: hypothetical protein ACJ72D_30885 [Marmoricola sp.]